MPIPAKYFPSQSQRVRFESVLTAFLASEYKIPYATTNPKYVGGCSVLFAIPGKPGRLLRLEMDSGKLWNSQARVSALSSVSARLDDIMPKIYKGLVVPLVNGASNYGLIAQEIEELELVDWKDWRMHFKSATDLAKALMTVFQRMIDARVGHTDMSINNVVLTRKGRVLVIDLLDSCFTEKQTNTSNPCFSEPVATTLGFTDASLWVKPEKKYADATLKLTKIVFGANAPQKLQRRFGKWNMDRHLENLKFAAGATLMCIATNHNDVTHVTASEFAGLPAPVQQVIRSAMHPNLSERFITVPQGSAGHYSNLSEKRALPANYPLACTKDECVGDVCLKKPRVSAKKPQQPTLVQKPPVRRRVSARRSRCNKDKTRVTLTDGSTRALSKGPQGGLFYRKSGRRSYVKC